MTAPTEHDQQLIKLHCDYMRRTGATESTLHHRRANLLRFARRIPCEIAAITATDLDRWQSGLRVSLSSIGTYTSHVRSFYRWAHETGLLDVDPSTRLPRPRIPTRLPRPIPAADLALALACAAEPVRTWIVLGAFMGLRAAEVAAIRREDITDVLVDGRPRTMLAGIGKGRKAFRLPVPAAVVPILCAHLGGQPGPLWRTVTGLPVTAHNITDEVTALFRRLGLPHTMHCCRHTFGTNVHRETHDLLMTADLMRHSSTNTTRLYVEPVAAEGTAAMDRLAAARLARRGRQPRRGAA